MGGMLMLFSNGSTVQGASQVDFSLKEDEAAISFFLYSMEKPRFCKTERIELFSLIQVVKNREKSWRIGWIFIILSKLTK